MFSLKYTLCLYNKICVGLIFLLPFGIYVNMRIEHNSDLVSVRKLDQKQFQNAARVGSLNGTLNAVFSKTLRFII